MKAQDYLSNEEIKALTQRSDAKGAWMFFCTWALIIGAFALAYLWPNPITIILSIMILAGRQLGLSVLVHDCGHHSLFKSRHLNQLCGNWLAGYAVFLDMEKYASGHLIHHRTAGTKDDPDLGNYKDYPISKESFYRKVWRDLTGQTAFKLITSLSLNKSKKGALNGIYNETNNVQHHKNSPNHTVRNSLIVNGVLLLALTLLAHPALYLLWVVAYFTVYMLILRIRQIAEHADVPDLYDPDPRNNTRTTYTNPLTRLLIAPNFVNYHLEHHILASVPAYNLKKFHFMLKQRGAYDDTPIANGYWEIIQQVTNQPATAAH